MEKIEIKLKECCLSCEHFSPSGLIGFGVCPVDGKRIIACGHMEVCYKYINSGKYDKKAVMET